MTILEPDDYFGTLVFALSQPMAGEEVPDPDIRVPKPLRSGGTYWEGYINPSGRPGRGDKDPCLGARKPRYKR